MCIVHTVETLFILKIEHRYTDTLTHTLMLNPLLQAVEAPGDIYWL